MGDNVYDLLPLETYQWWYHRTFRAPPDETEQRVFLVFDGLDCLGTIWLNRRQIGATDNMLIPHRFDVTNDLRPQGENELHVRIASAVLAGRRHEVTPAEFALPGKWEALQIRKAAHMYGWDIMPRIVSAGLWRDVYLEPVNTTRLNSVYWATQSVDLESEDGDAAAGLASACRRSGLPTP